MTRLPPSVRAGVEEALAAEGAGGRVVSVEGVGGGCINQASKVETDDGRAFFLKWNRDAPPEMFAAEADGLRALAAPGALRVPEVVAVGDAGAPGEPAWLLLEYVPPGRPVGGYAVALGRGLARLHREGADPSDGWGWERDNFIGSLPQRNGSAGGWVEFWRERRLLPQLRAARDAGHLAREGAGPVESLLGRLDDALHAATRDGPSLLHGDLWGGNVHADRSGEPVLVDPAVYRGHREVDLAMSELFGGFPPGFLEAYREAWPLAPGYAELRRPTYQLYYLLVHVNLFGSGYVARTLGAARSALAAL